ncbi:hypothetical protein [Halobellus rubicundus]|uniref:Uncharacterized protein n=1 Tax=Halobellus rubicundus TaxID=2996466 RepID=A0ABD5MFI4_9EURY
MTDDADAADPEAEASNESLDDVVTEFLRDVDAAREDYDRGYTDADATLSVVLSHVDRLREAFEDSDE